jgi:AraC-like DNA-binding protein/DNA gyrase inhibitor GyrI
MDYIEQNLDGTIDLNEAAKAGAVSLMQLYRQFYAYTGHTLKEYIRKRHLSNACALLKFTDTPLVEVALLNGFETQQAFHKYFKSVLGVTPYVYKSSEAYFYFTPTFHQEIPSFPVKVEYEMFPITLSIMYSTRQQNGIEARAISCLYELISEYPFLAGNILRLFGRNIGQTENQFQYELNIAVKDMALWESVFPNRYFPKTTIRIEYSGTYASCIVKNEECEILSGWNYLYNTWLRASMFTRSQEDFFEEYFLKEKENRVQRLKLYLPVKKNQVFRTISIQELPAMSFIINVQPGVDKEETSARLITNFLMDHAPNIMYQATEFYLSYDTTYYESGIKIDDLSALPELPKSKEVELIHSPPGSYAVLEDDCCGDYSIQRDHLIRWMLQHGFSKKEPKIFTIYEVKNNNFNDDQVRMKLYAKCDI